MALIVEFALIKVTRRKGRPCHTNGITTHIVARLL